MKNTGRFLGIILVIFALQFTVVSCTSDNEIIKNQDDKIQLEKTGHGQAGNPPVDDDEEWG